MRVLALDLGVTTGWASVYKWMTQEESTVVASGVFTYEQYPAQLQQILEVWPFAHVVMELPLLIGRGQLQQQLENVVAWTMSSIGDLPRTEVYASEWKGTKYAKAKTPKGITTHERDAIRMGLWFSEQRLQGA